ncbi:DUF89 domain-containing protein [Haematococcus lacustris]|uniref:Sugar phosphate phosphatase n=1 Tax=Haematococcus lacustris TaxID=44745 RepID=A0A6A0A1Y3_HAELA|nr:DUF89 domain-containing protein [Haematococcus lacustris]
MQAKLGAGMPATWLNLPWLLVECYLYVHIAAAVQAQPLLAEAGFDCFATQKAAGWIKSVPAAQELAEQAEAVHLQLHPSQLPLQQVDKAADAAAAAGELPD